MNFIQTILPESITYATGIMILHMLWQGLTIAILLGFILIIFKNSSPQSRYTASVFALALMPIVALITFLTELNKYNYLVEIQKLSENATAPVAGSNGLIDQFLSMYVTYLPLIVLIWIIGVSALLLKSLGNLVIIQRLKNYYLQEVSENILNLISTISKKFNIKKKVQVHMSTKARTPMVIGHMKPVLLLPSNSTKNLSEEELSAVLHHELAHIKRNDYIINIFQTIIEIIFFFHPATWWISGIIRKEREECCDVYAIEKEQDKLTLAKALTSLEENQYNTTLLAMSALGNNSSLIKRIKNMFKNRPVMPSFKEGIIVTLFFVVTIGLFSFMMDESQSKKPEETEAITKTLNGELTDGKYLFAKTDQYGNIKELFVEGKKIKKREYKDYKNAVDSLSKKTSKPVKEKISNHNRNMDEYYENITKESVNREIQAALDELNANLTRKEKEQLKKDIKEANNMSSEILSEVTSSISEELKEEFGENFNFSINIDEENEKVIMKIDENNFIIDINDEGENVIMKLDETGFIIDVDENGEKVKMSIDENGFYLNVEENGKNTVNISLGVDGIKIKEGDDK